MSVTSDHLLVSGYSYANSGWAPGWGHHGDGNWHGHGGAAAAAAAAHSGHHRGGHGSNQQVRTAWNTDILSLTTG